MTRAMVKIKARLLSQLAVEVTNSSTMFGFVVRATVWVKTSTKRYSKIPSNEPTMDS